MTSRPASLGNPRSMIATSSGYSRPANRPSSPSCATSTVKPASISRVLIASRNAASSSTTSARMPLASADPDLQNHAARRIDTHRPDVSGIVEESQNVDRATVLVLRLCAHDSCLEPLLDHLHRLIHRDAGLGEPDNPCPRKGYSRVRAH